MAPLEGYARGWFCVGFSEELPVGAVKSLRYFGQDLVLFRDEAGVARMLDAHCPHLGAHLGYGGVVVGESIRCPFHGWRFDGEGKCVDVPYASKIPPKAEMRCWPVREIGGVLFVYHDRERRPPSFELPELEEPGTPEWLSWTWSSFRMKTHPKEVVENVADRAHFPFVHNTVIDEFDFVVDGPRCAQVTRGRAMFGEKAERFALTATYHGPAILLTRMAGLLKSLQLVMVTPIDDTWLDLRYAVTLKRIGDDQAMQGYAQQYLENLRDGFLQDQAIWENKLYRERPTLADGDGPIGALRRWYRQFYGPADAAGVESAPVSAPG